METRNRSSLGATTTPPVIPHENSYLMAGDNRLYAQTDRKSFTWV